MKTFAVANSAHKSSVPYIERMYNVADNTTVGFNSDVIENIEREAKAYLDAAQLEKLRETLLRCLQSNTLAIEDTNAEIVRKFCSAKHIEGLAARTIAYYKYTVQTALSFIKKHIKQITTDDIRIFLAEYPSRNGAGMVTMNNIRRNLSSFFSWLEDEDLIVKSPMRRIKNIKTRITIKEAYTDEMLERMRNSCESKRDLAILNVLTSTGIRIGELVKLDVKDIDFINREFTVLGKGNKERIVYFDARAKMALERYLASRKNNASALFVWDKAPYKRIGEAVIAGRLRKLGERIGVHVHPHKFRRTMATMAIDKGMPIEQVQFLLGHQSIDTTLKYAMVGQANVKISHRKFFG